MDFTTENLNKVAEMLNDEIEFYNELPKDRRKAQAWKIDGMCKMFEAMTGIHLMWNETGIRKGV